MVILLIYICCSGILYTVILGANRRDITENGALRVTAITTISHPQYNPNNLNNDIAVIQLPNPVVFTSEYCHILLNIKIILFVLKHVNCLFTAQTFICLTHLCCQGFTSLLNTPCSVAISLVSNNCHS